MKKTVIVFLIMVLFVFGQAQETGRNRDFDYTAYGQMIYWKTLNLEEKKVFLYAYLYRTHEIGNELKASRKLKSAAARYDDEIAQPVYRIFSDLDEASKTNLIYWIDTFYQQELNRNESFKEALQYAFRKLKTGAETMHDVYQRIYPQ